MMGFQTRKGVLLIVRGNSQDGPVMEALKYQPMIAKKFVGMDSLWEPKLVMTIRMTQLDAMLFAKTTKQVLIAI